jgi:hypothetical protein
VSDRRRIGGRNAVKQAAHEPRQRNGEQPASSNPQTAQHERMQHDAVAQVARLRPEGEPDAELARALRDRQDEDAVHAERGETEGGATEEREGVARQTAILELTGERVLDGGDAFHRNRRIGALHDRPGGST